LRGGNSLDSCGLGRLDDLGHLPGGHFQLRRDDVLVPCRDPRRAAFHQLSGAKRGDHDKLERIRSIGPGNHVNLLEGDDRTTCDNRVDRAKYAFDVFDPERL
jgi:hypothetical protein